MHNEGLHKLYFPPNIISVAKFEENRSQGRQRYRGQGNIKINLKAIGQHNVDWIHMAGNFLNS
jgi:hypothetical protein